MNLLEVRSISKTYGSGEAAVHALKKVSFSVPKGEFVAVVGESGSGKSTLLNMVGALDNPTSGKVLIDGKDIFAMKDRNLTVFRRRNIGFIFQSFNLIPELTVEQNITLRIRTCTRKIHPDSGCVIMLSSVIPWFSWGSRAPTAPDTAPIAKPATTGMTQRSPVFQPRWSSLFSMES